MKSTYIVDASRRTLRDDFLQTQTYSDTDFVDYINRAVRFIINADSSASVQTSELSLVVGSLQALPLNGVRVLKIFHNNLASTLRKRIGVRGYSGRSNVKNISLSTLDSQVPNWAGASQSSIAVYYVFNSDAPTAFIVYPPNDGTGKLIASWSFVPTEITTIADTTAGTILLPERFTNVVLNYVMALCLSRDNASSVNRTRGQEMMQSVAAELGVKGLSDTSDTPTDTSKE